ncbi:lamin tail domain-containing protein [Candidatus Pacearchaeota archaeon]|nr:lamin tail domain-containing protein [Candidatus Pacearchaeota archaeon]
MTNIIKKGTFPLLAGFFILLFAVFASAGVFINEIELNPAGSDNGNEWVEIFANSDENISGWYITDRDDNRFYFPNISIDENSFYVLDGLDDFVNSDENITLYNEFNFFQDEALNLSDSDNNGQTWQRLPDGNGDFVFKSSTKGVSNQITSINSKAHYPGCLIKGDEVILSANVTGFCVDEVIFSVFTQDGQVNITGVSGGVNEDNYTAVVNSSLLNAYNNVLWTVYAKDCFNQSVSNGNENFYLNNGTELLVNSSSPDGANGWYVTEPVFSLENGDALGIFYRWNDNYFTYTGVFDLDGTPNNGNVTGGAHSLRYWSNFSCKMENENLKVFKFDFLAPVITDLTPGNLSVISDVAPEISAYFDEVYQSNSGMNTSAFSMLLDNESIGFNIQNFGLDSKIKYNANNLSEGVHIVKLSGMDKAGHYSEMEWAFEVNLSTIDINVSVNSPVNQLYDSRNVPINITLNKEAEYIKYINYNDRRPSWKVLCRNCDNYGEEKARTKRLLEGENNLSFMAIDSSGSEFIENASLFIDSIAPKIKKVEPKKGYVDSNFNIEITESNPASMLILYTNGSVNMSNEVNLSECTQVKSVKYCNGFVDLSEFNGQEIEYYVNLTDIMNRSVVSKENSVMVDTVNPVINSIDFTNIKKRVEFKINATEENLDEISYIDWSDRIPKERRLCTRLNDEGMCVKVVTFRTGDHNLTVYAYDKAGNTAFVNDLEFSIA